MAAASASISKLTISGLSVRALQSHSGSRLCIRPSAFYAFWDCKFYPFLKEEKRDRLGRVCLNRSKVTKIECRRVATRAMTELRQNNKQYMTLVYDYIPNILEERGKYRADHLAVLKQYVDDGKVLLAGPWGSSVNGALMIWHVHDSEEVQEFVEQDPYVRNGLVTKFDIRPYSVVIGTQYMS